MLVAEVASTGVLAVIIFVRSSLLRGRGGGGLST